MEILNGFEASSILKAVHLLKNGELVAFPTETVYGLGADAFNPYAVAKIFEVKGRPKFDPLIVHIDNKEWLSEIAIEIPESARKLIDRFWPGPMTLILKKSDIIPDIVTSGLPTVGIRFPSHPVAKKLIEALGRPIAAPSANPFGYISPTKALHVAHMLKNRIKLVLDGGSSVYGIESTIISFQNEHTFINRHGAISLEEIKEITGEVKSKEAPLDKCESPGMLPYHYSPLTPLKIIDSTEEIEKESSGFLAFRRPVKPVLSKYVKILSESGDLREAASNFFSYLIELDQKGVEIIYAEKVPEKGLGRAIMERLKKASKKYNV